MKKVINTIQEIQALVWFLRHNGLRWVYSACFLSVNMQAQYDADHYEDANDAFHSVYVFLEGLGTKLPSFDEAFDDFSGDGFGFSVQEAYKWFVNMGYMATHEQKLYLKSQENFDDEEEYGMEIEKILERS